METGNKIEKHYDDEEILKITLNKELEDWKNELSFIGKELLLLKNLLNSISHNGAVTPKNSDVLHKNLNQYIEKNKKFYDQTLNFSHKTMEIRECEDLNCETYFFNEHFDFHEKLRNHLEQVRALKLNTFNHLNKKVNETCSSQ